MESKFDMQMMVQTARMYYFDGLTQQSIAKELGISRSYISMLLSEARELGIVDIKIKNPLESNKKLADALQDAFGIANCFVTPTVVTELLPLTKILAAQGVLVAEKLIESHSTVGIAWGLTCYEFMKAFSSNTNLFDVNVVPLIGGSHHLSSEFQLNEMVRFFAEKLKGTPSFIYAPALAESIEDKALHMKSQYMQSIVEKWRKIDVAIVGVGSPPEYYGDKSQFDPVAFKTIYEENPQKSVGDISARRFSIHGAFMDNEYNDRIMGIDEENLRNAKNVLSIAAGQHKVLSIIGALRLHIITHFVTDENTAKMILSLV
jgi:deoxyribonucleoside regulator